jgi:nitroreductase
LYKERTAPESYDAGKYNKIVANGDKASHLVVVWMQRGAVAKIPADEELAATAAAIEHILLGATAMGYASFWGSGGMTHHPALKEMLGLRSEDVVMAMLYLGTGPVSKPGTRLTPLEQKVQWFDS